MLLEWNELRQTLSVCSPAKLGHGALIWVLNLQGFSLIWCVD